MVRELAVVLGYQSPAEIARDSVISFRMVDGRVYHRDLELVFPDITIRTYGSVGIGPSDRSLAIMAKTPLVFLQTVSLSNKKQARWPSLSNSLLSCIQNNVPR